MTAPLPLAAALGLSGIAALHLVWATGSAWPAADRGRLADVTVGRPDGSVPAAAACVAVAAACTAAAVLVAGRPRRPRLRRGGAAVVVATLASRGVLGLAGRTDLMAPGSTSAAFRRRDRRFYAPLCLVLAGAALPSVTASC